MENKALSAKTKFWFGFGDFGFTLMSNVETFYWNAFLTNLAGFTVAMTGVITSVASTIDACLSWIYGGLINAWKPGKSGRYRTWLIKITWIVPFIYAFQFLRVSDNDAVAATVCCAAAVISHIIWNFPYAANATMVSVAAQGVPENRAALASSRATWNNLSGVVFSYVMVGFTAILPEALKGNKIYGTAAFVFGIVMVIGYYVHFKVTDGLEEIEDPNNPKQMAKSATPADMGRALVTNVPLLLLVVADLAKWLVKFLVAGAAVYYFTYANGTTLQANYVLFANIMGVIGAYIARFINKKLTNRGGVLFSYAWMAVLMIVAYFLYASPTAVFVIMILAQFGYGMAYASTPALYADTAVYARWKSGKDSTGWIMGLQTVPLKVAVLIKSIILNAALAMAGYEAYRVQISDAVNAGTIGEFAATLPASLKQGVCGAFSLWSGVFCLVGFLIILFGFKLTKEKVAEYQAEIDAKA